MDYLLPKRLRKEVLVRMWRKESRAYSGGYVNYFGHMKNSTTFLRKLKKAIPLVCIYLKKMNSEC